jgi:hypothetical protein
LLLRHLGQVEQRVSLDAFHEVTRSLQVTRDQEGYLVRWSRDGRAETKRYAASEFTFYYRGDTDAASRVVDEDLRTNNDAVARQFAADALGIQLSEPVPHPTGRDRIPVARLAVHAAPILLLALVGCLRPGTAVILFALGAVEYLRGGRLLTSLVFIAFAVVAPGAAILGAAAYGALQYLDPDPTHRAIRIAGTFVAVAAGVVLFRFESAAVESTGWLLVLLVVAAGAISAFRSLVYAHRRAMPLAMPFLWAGFAFDGALPLAITGLCLSSVEGVITALLSRLRRRHSVNGSRRRALEAAPQPLQWMPLATRTTSVPRRDD